MDKHEMLLSDQDAKYITDLDLVSIIFNENGNQKAEKLLEDFSINDLPGQSVEALEEYGLSGIEIERLKMIGEYGRRLAFPKLKINQINGAQDSYEALRFMESLEVEELHVVVLNSKNQILETTLTTRGTINSNLGHPREVFRNAIKRNAASIILAHNHPSGDSTPSTADIKLTKRFVEAGKVLGIDVLDHIIIGNGRFCSLREEGYIE